MIIAEPKRKMNAPRNGLKPNRIPSANPGSATWERASPTSAIFSSTIRPPRYPAASPTATATIIPYGSTMGFTSQWFNGAGVLLLVKLICEIRVHDLLRLTEELDAAIEG